MSVIIRLQNLPWSANALDIRTFFRGLSIPEGGVHIVGGEQGDAFIAFSTDEDARQAMINDGGKIKEVQVKLLLSSRSEMHKVIETARQAVSFMQLASQPALPAQPVITQASLPATITGLLAQNIKQMMPSAIPLNNFIESIPKPIENPIVDDRDFKKNRDLKSSDRKQRSRSSSRDRSKKDRGRDKKDKRDRSRSRDRSRDRDRRRRDRSRSRDRRDRKRDRKDRSRDRDRSKEKSESRNSFRKDEKKIDLSIDNKGMSPALSVQKDPFIMKPNDPSLLGVRLGAPIVTPNDPRRQFGIRAPGQSIQSMQPMQPMQGMPMPRQPFMNQNVNMRMGWSPDTTGITGMNPRMPMMPTQTPNIRGNLPDTNVAGSMLNQPSNNMEQQRLKELVERRNPNAFQNADPIQNHNAPNQDTRPRPNGSNEGYGRTSRFGPPHNFNDRNDSSYNDSRSRFRDKKGLCIKISNLPHHAGYGDIRRFFSGLFISGQGLKLINDNNGRRTGVALVKFFKPESKIEALKRTGHNLKGETIVIAHLDEDDFDSAIDGYTPRRDDSPESNDDIESNKNLIIVEHDDKPDQPFKVLYLEDLPPFAKEQDIMKMFSDYSLLSITLLCTKDVRKQYVAYVQFVHADDAKAALNNKSKHLIGHISVKVSPCTDSAYEQAMINNNAKELQNANDETEHDTEMDSDEINEPTPPEPVLPQSRDPRQRRFENRIEETDIPFNNNSVPFPGPPMHNNMRFSWRPNNQGPPNAPLHMMGDNRERMSGPRGSGPMMSNNFDRNQRSSDNSIKCVFLKGLPLRTTDRDVLDFFSDVGVIPSKIHLMLTIQGEPSGDCFCELVEANDTSAALSKNGSMLGTNTVSVELVPKSVVDDALGIPSSDNQNFGPPMRGFRGGRGGFFPRGRGRGRGGRDFHGRGGGRFHGPPSYDSQDNPEGFGKPGCVVSLENVPFRAGVNEILAFFQGFDLAQSDVIRRFNEMGHPTGDARVDIHTPFEAQRAIKQLNMKLIRDRPITLRIL